MYNLIVILGPTASGKTQLAIELAHSLDSEIISADSRQVYKGMDIGTGKDLASYKIGNKTIPTHLIDIREAGDTYHIAQFQEDFKQAYAYISAKSKIPILCGGSGMYIEAVLRNFQFTSIPIDENFREKLQTYSDEELKALFDQHPSAYTPLADLSTRKRLIRAIEISVYLQHNAFTVPEAETIRPLIIGLNPEVEIRRARITKRLHERFDQGLVQEVQQLLQTVPAEKLIYYGLEYKFITQYLQGELDEVTLGERLNVAIHQFAKRQMTYFRHMEKNGWNIHWLDIASLNEQIEEIKRLWSL